MSHSPRPNEPEFLGTTPDDDAFIEEFGIDRIREEHLWLQDFYGAQRWFTSEETEAYVCYLV